MPASRSWFFLLISLSLIWGGVAAVMVVTDDQVSSPEEVLELMAEAPWLAGDIVPSGERMEYVEEVIANANRLSFEERAEVREEGQAVEDAFFDSLTEEEQKRFVDATVEKSFEIVMTGLNAMSPEDRKGVISRIRRDMQKRGIEPPPGAGGEGDADALEEMMSLGMEAYYRDASAETKMELAPVLEDMQARLQGFKR